MHDDDVSGDGGEARSEGGSFASIARVVDDAIDFGFEVILEEFAGAVGGAVVNDDDF